MKGLYLTLLLSMSGISDGADITVSAAASLTDAFSEIASRYEAVQPQNKVYLNFAGSGALLQQIIHGAAVDVFAPADQWRIEQAEQADLLLNETREVFAANTLVAIVPVSDKTNYANMEELLASDTIKHIAISNPDYVPAGRYSQQALEAQSLWQSALAKQIPTQNVRQTLDYVARGEVDAGLVYQTDANMAANKVRVVLTIPLLESITYPIAVLKNSEQPQAAQQFVDFVLSETGQAILQRYGFTRVERD